MTHSSGKPFRRDGGKLAKGLEEEQQEGTVSFSKQSRGYHALLTKYFLDFRYEKCASMKNMETYVMNHYLSITIFNSYHDFNALFIHDFLVFFFFWLK